MQLSPLRQFLLTAALWLPLCFFLWAVLIAPLLLPVAKLTNLVLQMLMSDVIEMVEQDGAAFNVVTRLLTEADAGGRIGQLILSSTPMIYAWCLPLFAGLVMAAPVSMRQRLLQFSVGLPVLWLVITWGAVFDVFYLLQFKAGALGTAALESHGFKSSVVGLGYQFGYLILPTVTPVALWIMLNQGFVNQLVEFTREPEADDPV